MKKKGFTLIELLAVIIILAIIALIATPIVLNVIEDTKENGRQSSVIMYADAVRLKVTEDWFQESQYPVIDKEYLNTITMQGEKVECAEVYYSNTFGSILHKCRVGDNTKEYYFGGNQIYENPEDGTYKSIYESVLNREYTDNSGANKPELVDKLIPVIYENNEWKVADIEQKWYDYDNKEWANAVILENGVTKNIGDTLNIDTEVAQMYVWIPRYEYKIPEYNLGRVDSDIHAIDIKFVNTSKTQANVDSGYNMHPGFKFGDVEVSGIWVGKFETTGENKDSQTQFTCEDTNCTQKVTIKPSYRASYGKVASQFYASRSIEKQYGLSNIDSHMAKYTEWTAISYLTNSIYGRCSDATHCEEVTINNSSNYYTGNADNTIYTSGVAGITNAYDTTQGMKASTTGNITGVYDMSGGILEYVMGVVTNVEELMTNPGYFYDSSGFSDTEGEGIENLGNLPDKRYYDSFGIDGTESYNYDALTVVNGVKGDYRGIFKELMTEATYSATVNWYYDYAFFVDANYPWFLLGGSANENAMAGVFGSSSADGSVFEDAGFRVVLTVQ